MAFDNDGDDRRATTSTDIDDERRRLLAGSAGALGALVLGGAGAVQPALGHEDDPFEDDVDLLNYALTLEYLEADFYDQGLDTIGEEKLLSSDPIHSLGEPIRDRVFSELRVIQEHEETHVDVLRDTIEDLGGDPIDEPEFEFGTATEEPDEFLALAAQLEDTGVSAYAGAAPEIDDPDLVPPALSIHSVEARHASFIRVLNGEIGFPQAFDPARTREEVLEIAGQFIDG